METTKNKTQPKPKHQNHRKTTPTKNHNKNADTPTLNYAHKQPTPPTHTNKPHHNTTRLIKNPTPVPAIKPKKKRKITKPTIKH